MSAKSAREPQSPRWLRHAGEPWHGWLPGARASLCNEITLYDLATTPVAAAVSQLPTGAQDVLCPACAEKAGVCGLLSSEAVSALWEGLIRKQFKRHRLRLAAREDIEDFADLLSRLGPPSSPEAAYVWRHLVTVIFKPYKSRRTDAVSGKQRIVTVLPSFKSIVAQRLPPDPDKLRQVAETIALWCRVTGKNPTEERFNPDKVIQTILEIPEPVAYVTRLKEVLESANLALMFHPTTLSRARKDPALRGLWWDGAKHEGTEGTTLLDGVDMVRDE